MTIAWTPNPDRPASPLTASGKCLTPSGEHGDPVDGRCTTCGAIATTPVDLTKATDPCTRCGNPTTPTPLMEIDPLCAACRFDLAARDAYLPIDTLHDLAYAWGPIATADDLIGWMR